MMYEAKKVQTYFRGGSYQGSVDENLQSHSGEKTSSLLRLCLSRIRHRRFGKIRAADNLLYKCQIRLTTRIRTKHYDWMLQVM